MSENEKHDPGMVRRLKRIGIAILILGLLSAITVFIFASEAPDNATAYQIIDGVSYPVDVNNTKSYNYNMERIGGKTAVFASDLSDWFSSLWHGKKLSYTLAILSIVSTLLCFWLAYLFSLPPHDDEVENKDWKG
jgi:hypothetical protein